jgi:hypothetical protein
MVIERPRPARIWLAAALLALVAGAAQLAGGWRGSLRVDAGDRAQVVVDVPPSTGAWQPDQEGGWEALWQAAGIRVRLVLTPMPNCD